MKNCSLCGYERKTDFQDVEERFLKNEVLKMLKKNGFFKIIWRSPRKRFFSKCFCDKF
jgi:hypothetical protein